MRILNLRTPDIVEIFFSVNIQAQYFLFVVSYSLLTNNIIIFLFQPLYLFTQIQIHLIQDLPICLSNTIVIAVIA